MIENVASGRRRTRPLEWKIRSEGLYWSYQGVLYNLADAHQPTPTVSRPARDVLQALLRYTLEQLEGQDVPARPVPPVDF